MIYFFRAVSYTDGGENTVSGAFPGQLIKTLEDYAYIEENLLDMVAEEYGDTEWFLRQLNPL